MNLAPLSVVVVARNEAPRLPSLLADLALGSSLVREVLVVDGESSDRTAAVARLAGARVVRERASRGRQLARGVNASSGDWLLLLHGDGRLPTAWEDQVAVALARQGTAASGHRDEAWCFPLAIEGRAPALRLVELGVALRSRWRQLPYGDQGLLLPRTLYVRCGGIAPLPLMEDLEFVLRLRRQARIRCLPEAITVHGRRWNQRGVWSTTFTNARLRRAWRRGVPPETLAEIYDEAKPRRPGMHHTPTQGEYQKAQRRCSGSSSHPWAS
jgi:rSAM/selenodomain-associated transferase 2